MHRQITWIHNRLESRVQHLIKLDTSYLDQWNQVVSNPAENAVSHLLDNTLPSIQINHDHWDEQSISYIFQFRSFYIYRRNKKFECSICNKTIIGEDQWKEHVKGRVHKRHVESKKRQEAKEKYFREKGIRLE